jgi:hypothetical protein
MVRKCLIGVVLTAALSLSVAAQEVFVRVGPPHDVVERRERAPSRGHVWIAGYHRWDGGAYVWVPGRWEMPPRQHAHWVRHHWVHRHGGWVLVEGHWA